MFLFEEDFGDDPLNFQCNVLDANCKITEGMAHGLADAIEWFQTFLFVTDKEENPLWEIAGDQINMWLGLAVTVMIITSIVGVATALVTQRSDLMKRTIIGSVLAFPATIFAYFAVYQALRVADDVAEGLMKDTGGLSGAFGMLRQGNTGATGALTATVFSGTKTVLTLLLLIVLLLGLIVIFFALAFRDFALLLLIAFAPLAFILLPLKNGEVWVKRWVAAIFAMILAKPLIMATLGLIGTGFAKEQALFSATGFTLGIGMFIVGFMPLMLFSMFSFIGGSSDSDGVGSRVGAVVKGAGASVKKIALTGAGGGAGAATGVAAAGARGASGVAGVAGSAGLNGVSGKGGPVNLSAPQNRGGQAPGSPSKTPPTQPASPPAAKAPPTPVRNDPPPTTPFKGDSH